jgi:hypothetical protein
MIVKGQIWIEQDPINHKPYKLQVIEKDGKLWHRILESGSKRFSMGDEAPIDIGGGSQWLERNYRLDETSNVKSILQRYEDA